MDTHTLELLDFAKIRGFLAGYAACSLRKDAARALEPSRDLGEIRSRQALTTEMADCLSAGLSPPFGGLHDIRPNVRRAQTGAMLSAEDLAIVVEVLRAIANLDAWLNRVGGEFPRLGGLKSQVGEFSGVANAIEGCLDERGNVLDTASRKLSAIRREVKGAEDKIQETLRRMLRSNEIKRILRYPNFTMVGHHYVLPVAKEHRAEIQGSVHRTSASNETVFVEPQAIAEQSAQLAFLRANELKEIRRILRWLSAPGRASRRLADRHVRNDGRTRFDLCTRKVQPRLPHDPARLQRARPDRPARGAAPDPGKPLPRGGEEAQARGRPGP